MAYPTEQYSPRHSAPENRAALGVLLSRWIGLTFGVLATLLLVGWDVNSRSDSHED